MAPKNSNPKVEDKQRSVGKRHSLTDELNRFSTDPNGNPKITEIANTAWERAKESYGFDNAAPTTQNRRKRHLAEYEFFINGMNKHTTGGDATEERKWGAEHITHNLRAYLTYAAQMTAPRSFQSHSIKLNTLVQRRQSLIYYVNRKCGDNVSRRDVWNATQETVHWAFRQFNKATAPAEKIYMTRFDLIGLIEHSMYSSRNAENAQQQQLAWLLGFVCGVRPGSIGTSRGRKTQFLTWGDILIRRTSSLGGLSNFTVKIVFKYLKGYRDEKLRPLRFTCKGPIDPEDVICSIPHRILALALRRGILKDYKTVDELLAGDLVTIYIDESAHDMPVVCASAPKGTEVNRTKAATCDAISNYVQRTALEYGLPPGITHYAWRRSAGTRIAEALGQDKARGFLGHEMTSRTFESSYEQGTIALDAVAIAMGRKAQRSDELLREVSVSTLRIRDEINQKDEWIQHYVKANTDYIRTSKALNAAEVARHEDEEDEAKAEALKEASREFNSVRRALQTQGRLAFQRLELKLLEERMTQTELDERLKQEGEAGRLQRMLLAEAEQAREDARAMIDAQDEPDELRPDDLQDAQSRLDDMDDTGETVDIEVPNLRMQDDGDDQRQSSKAADDNPELAALHAASKTMLEILIGIKEDKPTPILCPKCVADETIPETAEKGLSRTKTWLPVRLDQHLAEDVHSPKRKWLRVHQSDEKQPCPFDRDCEFKGTNNAILQHARTATDQTKKHLLAVAADGILARDFDPSLLRSGRTYTKKVGGKMTMVEMYRDPDNVELSELVHPRNLTSDGKLDPTLSSSHKTEAAVRLPPQKPLTESVYWKTHEPGIYGEIPDKLQEQRAWLAKKMDQTLRDEGYGQANEKGETKGSSRTKGLDLVRKTLPILRQQAAEYGFAWAEDEDNIAQPGEDLNEEEWTGFSDPVEPSGEGGDGIFVEEGDDDDDDGGGMDIEE